MAVKSPVRMSYLLTGRIFKISLKQNKMTLYYQNIIEDKSPLSSPLHWPLSSQTRSDWSDLIEMISKCSYFSYDSPLDVMVDQIPRRKSRPREGANRAKHDRPSASVSVSDMKKFLCDFCHKRYGTAGSLQVGNIFIISFRLMGTSLWFCYVDTSFIFDWCVIRVLIKVMLNTVMRDI